MRVLMLGWEFPPYISGGLGTACHGLTKALSRQGVEVLFVLPRAVESGTAEHVRLLSPLPGPGASSTGARVAGVGPRQGEGVEASTYQQEGMEGVTFRAVPSVITNPYNAPGPGWEAPVGRSDEPSESESAALKAATTPIGHLRDESSRGSSADYSGDMLAEAHRYAEMCVKLTRRERFDVIHAHDWMTYPAGLALARATGKPLVVHVHSTEYDRAGENIHTRIAEIERRGMHGAMRVICVSMLTRNIVVHRYGVPEDKCVVCYNGIEMDGPVRHATTIRKGDKIVLFLGRITMQKGPEYFVAAAKKVLEKIDNVKFVMAGAGDLVPRVIELAAEMGIGHKVLFTGFLRGPHVEKIFQMADVYVMPSVSEPFGIAPLEAIRHDVPVIISKNSGVAEVLSHALKVDFWDTQEMANKIIAVLRHPPLSQTLREHADFEVRQLTWDGAAEICRDVYEQAIAGVMGPVPAA